MANIPALFFILLASTLGFSCGSQQSTNIDSEITTEMGTQSENSTELPVLSRKRRYVVFPRGSSFQLVYCENTRLFIPLTKRFQFGVTMGLAWMLPTEAHQLYLQKRDVDDTLASLAYSGYGVVHRADMYKVLEGFLSLKGLKGRDCILRAVCEASEVKNNQTSEEYRQGTFMEELHKILFRLPVHPKHKTPYDEARERAGKCGESYSGCHSFLDLSI